MSNIIMSNNCGKNKKRLSLRDAFADFCLFAACSMSELSSLHDAETDFRQTYRQVQKKALPAIPDLDDPTDLRTTDLSPVHEERFTRQPQQRNHVADDNPR